MSEKNQAFNVLFLCTGNSCRSILAEATFNHLAPPGWRAMSAAFDVAMARIGPGSISALLLTLVLLFAFQGEAIIHQPLVIALLAVAAAISLFGFESGPRWRRSSAC